MTSIPKNHVDFCKAVAKLAAEHQLNSFALSFKPRFDDPWRSEITANWCNGRHGDDMDGIRISSTVQVFEKVGLYEK